MSFSILAFKKEGPVTVAVGHFNWALFTTDLGLVASAGWRSA